MLVGWAGMVAVTVAVMVTAGIDGGMTRGALQQWCWSWSNILLYSDSGFGSCLSLDTMTFRTSVFFMLWRMCPDSRWKIPFSCIEPIRDTRSHLRSREWCLLPSCSPSISFICVASWWKMEMHGKMVSSHSHNVLLPYTLYITCMVHE